MITLIWAEGTVVDANDIYNEYPRVIGVNGNIPWLGRTTDLALFRAITMGHNVVVGRKTWETLSIKPQYRYLTRRHLYVATRSSDLRDTEFAYPQIEADMGLTDETLVSFNTLTQILLMATIRKKQEWFIAGGVEVYNYFMPIADKLFVSIREGDPIVTEIAPGTLRNAPLIDKERYQRISSISGLFGEWELQTYMRNTPH